MRLAYFVLVMSLDSHEAQATVPSMFLHQCQIPGCDKPSIKVCGWPTDGGQICAKRLCFGHSRRAVRKNVDYCPKHWQEKARKLNYRSPLPPSSLLSA